MDKFYRKFYLENFRIQFKKKILNCVSEIQILKNAFLEYGYIVSDYTNHILIITINDFEWGTFGSFYRSTITGLNTNIKSKFIDYYKF